MSVQHISKSTAEVIDLIGPAFRKFHFARLLQSVAPLQGNWTARVHEAEKLALPIAFLEAMEAQLDAVLIASYAGHNSHNPLMVEEALRQFEICIQAMTELELG